MSKDYSPIFDLARNLYENSSPEHPLWHVKPKNHRWDYVDGCMIKGAMELYSVTKDRFYFDVVKKFVDHYVEPDGNISGYDLEEYNIDHINGGKVLFELYNETGDARYKNAIELLMKQLKGHPRTNEGNFWHKQIYPNQVWLDGLYMAQPFYARHDIEFGGKQNISDIMQQFQNVYRLMRDKSTGLFYHGYDESREIFWANKETGLSPHFWSRAMGWYAMALADTAEALMESGNESKILGEHLHSLCDALNKQLSPDKMLYQVTDMGSSPGNYTETSGSLSLAYSMMKGARLGIVPKSYFEKGKDIFESVVQNKLIIQDGKPVLKDTVLVSGLGGMPGMGDYKLRDGSYEYYISEPKADNDGKGVAILFYALSEVLRNG